MFRFKQKLFLPRFSMMIFLLIAMAVGLIYFSIRLNLKDQYRNYSIVSYRLESKAYKLLVANTPEKWQQGLMNFRKLKGIDGMIFLFPDKQIRSFWNKNTYLDLNLYWLDDEKIIGKSYLPSIEKSQQIVTVFSPKPANKVIEVVK